MLSNEKKPPNDKKEIIDQFLKFQNIKVSAIMLSAIISSANAFNAIAFGVINRAKLEKTLQSSSSIKRD